METCRICGRAKTRKTYEIKELGIKVQTYVACKCEVKAWEEWKRVHVRGAWPTRAESPAQDRDEEW